MFLSRLGEKSGLFGILAPRRRKHGHAAQEASIDENEQRQASNNQDNGDHLPINNTNEPKRAKKVSDARERQQTTSQEHIIRKRRLDAQQKAETEAESRGAFCKKQRVKYHNKLLGKWDDAVIVGVHYDDGPDKPYYVRATRETSVTLPRRCITHFSISSIHSYRLYDIKKKKQIQMRMGMPRRNG